MAFLDNSGDIILDAVLTDTGRMRLARGDGSFKIAKFAFGDDEINYAQYDKNNTNGSAYYDLEILQTPILEAFTNNTASLRTKLLSISRTNLLYLPVVELNTVNGTNKKFTGTNGGYFGVAVDTTTQDVLGNEGFGAVAAQNLEGIINGANLTDGTVIRCDQGLDTTEISADNLLDADLVETQYIIEMDNRLGSLASPSTTTGAAVSFIDDDNIASYYLSLGTDTEFVTNNSAGSSENSSQVIAGPRGTTLQFRINASVDLNSSTFFFTELGSTTTLAGAAPVYYYIDSTIRVTGATTGYRIDIPVRFLKYKSAS
tara:strand:- start:547 stop:1491 length:945 start_codon:yes stop_codon:yes gene_type:complete